MQKTLPAKDKLLFILVRRFPSWLKPNHLTILRLALLAPLIWSIFCRQYLWLLVIVFLSCLTDILDGPLARYRKQESALGVFMDPLADRLIFFVPFIAVGWSLIPQLLFWLMILAEGYIFGLALFYVWLLKKIGLACEFTSNIFGKLKALVQLCILFLLVLFELAGWGWVWQLMIALIYLCLFFLAASVIRAITQVKPALKR